MRIFACLLLFGLLSGAVAAQSPKQLSLVIYRGASLIDTSRGVVRPDMSIVVEGPRIKAVVPTRELPAADLDNDDSRFAHGDDPKLAELFSDMRRRGTILDATVSIHASFEQHAARRPERRIYLCSSKLALQLTNQAWRAGVAISTGTDEVSPVSDLYPQLYDELTQLAAGARIPPAQVLKSATVIGARALGHEAEVGTIEPGKLANLMFVERSPLESLDNLKTVFLTVKRGIRYPRKDYLPVRPEEMPAEYRE